MEDLYKIEIWRHHLNVDKYENNDVREVVKWFKEEWQYVNDCGGCAFYVYKNR